MFFHKTMLSTCCMYMMHYDPVLFLPIPLGTGRYELCAHRSEDKDASQEEDTHRPCRQTIHRCTFHAPTVEPRPNHRLHVLHPHAHHRPVTQPGERSSPHIHRAPHTCTSSEHTGH